MATFATSIGGREKKKY